MPSSLVSPLKVLWESPLLHSGLGGIAANESYVVFGDRDAEDFHDVFRCFNAQTGEVVWEVQRLAIGALDYGNSPRTTPLIVGDNVCCLGAFGDLVCLRLSDGELVWEHNLHSEYKADRELSWGYCGSPLYVDGKIVVAAGAVDASLIAFESATGDVAWKTKGVGPSYGSLITANLGGKEQIVGHDADSLGGWDIQTGERLWRLVPKTEGDFNVPTPLIHNGRLFVATENNGARLYDFDAQGRVKPTPVAVNHRLRPDMSSAVEVGGLLFCVKDFLFCLDLGDDLKEKWRIRDQAISDYASIIASRDRVLVIGDGELLLFDAKGGKQLLSRKRLFEESSTLYSHPAIVGTRIFIRGEKMLVCAEW